MKRLSSLLLFFAASLGLLRADAVVVFNEIMYHPATNEAAMEWVELRNQLAVDVDISGWSIAGGIQYTFPSNTVVKGGGHLVVALSPPALISASGATNVVGPFAGRLGNGGDLLQLFNNSGRIMDEVDYGVEDEWPAGADGAGVSLAKRDADAASGPAENWTTSEQSGGTPGARNFLAGGVIPETRLIAIDNSWKYEPTGTAIGNGSLAWAQAGFDDGSWPSRHAFTNSSVPTLFNTGIADNGTALAAGAADPHYTLTAAAQGIVPTNAMAMANNTAWAANDATSVWIGVNNNGANNANFGIYNYQTTFSLTGFLPSTVQVNAGMAVDNDVTNIFVNGVPTGLGASGFAGLSQPATLSGFVAGVNTIEFRTVNAGTAANPHGFRAAFTSSGLALNPNNPMPAGRTTYYFRKTFSFAGDPAFTQLQINAVIADGAVVYLNGVEVHRQNVPAGALQFSTPASSDVTSPGYTGRITIPAGSLVSGQNVLAVELHQASGSVDTPLFGTELFSTPLPEPPVTLAFSEFSSPTNNPFFVEIHNYGSTPFALTNYTLRHDGAVDHTYNFPATSLAPGAYLAVTAPNLGFTPVSGDKFYLIKSVSGQVIDSVVIKNRGRARAPQITSPWAFPSAPTPGAANTVAFRNEIVINEIMYNHARLPGANGLPPQESPEAWIELFNRGASPVDLTGWELGGGVSYVFSAGQIIPAGGYLVIADDVPYLKALYPGITIVGDFGGRLSGKSDRVILRDATGNVADEVRYFDDGRWPDYADGGGSSLELRDPNADNSKAEAWAASDETGKTGWQTYSYRMVANIPSLSGQPTTWQDFVLGLQSAGECLIDDISVIETPATTPVEIISNGNFTSGLSGWRVLGTHGRTQVIPEPGNPGNSVLHVVATGPQEHMHNHIERTLNTGRTIVNGREYQISYRARWLAGNNLVNTRLYFNRVARTYALPMPALNGTPGAQNSRYVANVGPTFEGFGHERVVPQPNESVTVNVVAADPNGVTTCEVFWSVNSGGWLSAAMTHQGGGAYTGTIPGQAAGAVVQFYVRAVDGLGAAATYPARGTNSGALFKVADGQADLSLAHNVRIILTPANINLLHGPAQGQSQTNVMSNDLLPCTVIYDERRAYYDCGVHLRGSQRGRYSDVRTGFHINFPPDDLFRGVHPVMLIDRSGAGDTASNRQEDIIVRHILNRAGGIPGTYSEICRVLAPRNAHTGAAQFFPRHEDLFIETAFENGNDGQMFEMELIYYPTTADAGGYKLPQPDSVVGTDITNLGEDKEIYRYNFMLKNQRDVDDYSRFITLAKAWSLTGNALEVQTRELMDIDQWMRAYCIISLCSIGDTYTFGNNHNFFTYMRPSDGKFVFFPWDMDFSFNRGETAALVGDQNLGKIVNLPANLRILYAHMLDIIDISFNSSYMTYWVNHYETFAPGQDYTPRAAYIQNRANYARTTITAQTGSAFTVAGTGTITTNGNLITLTGTAPAAARTIRINGVEYPITWTSVSAWRILVPVSEATTVLEIVGYDLRGNPIPAFSRTVTVNYTGATPDPTDAIVINEIMYNPVAPDAAYIELVNTSSNLAFNLSGWRINGIDYTFAPGSFITNRQYLVLAADPVAYVNTYGTNTPTPFGQFLGNLQNDGETLSLLRPGTNAGPEIVMDQVRYESVAPWATAPNGNGPSLQLIDPEQDNSRVANWSDGAGWRMYTYTGTMGANATNLSLFLSSAGELFVDNVSIVDGSVAEVGNNYVENGDFESGVLGPWITRGNHINSAISSAVTYGGNFSLRISSTGTGAANNLIDHALPLLTSGNVYTFSFRYLPSTNGSAVSFRVVTSYRNLTPIDFRPVQFTPGAVNSVRAVLPEFPALWINEALPQNLTGLADNQGEREPWIELYNAGATPINLTGYALANGYANLSQWAFPPGATIQPGQFKVIIADGEPAESTASEWHTGFRLSAGAGSVVLAWSPGGATQVLDYLNYTNVPPDRSYGSYPDGQGVERQEFYRVTPGGTNDNTAAPIVVYINEWMAANTSGLINTNNGNRFDDWIELYNPGNTPANLAGYYLSDNLANKTQFKIPPGYVIPPHGYLLVWADGEARLNTNTDPVLHVSFRLSQDGEAIGLFAVDGTTIDSVDFRTEQQFNNVSQGRFPDGPNASYYLATPTPLAANSTWANRYPVIAPIPDGIAFVGQPFLLNIPGTDPDLPAQTLTYALVSSSQTGTVVSVTGLLSWTPSASQSPGTNLITVRVTDNGSPVLSSTRSFRVIAGVGFQLTGVSHQNGNMVFNIGATIGKRYRVEYKANLSDPLWTTLTETPPAATASVTISDPIGANAQRFYRVLQLD